MRHCIEREPAIAEERDPAVTGGKPCCWPIGHPGTFGFRFCEAAALIGKPYCPEHAELAYVQIRNRREDGQEARRPGDLTCARQCGDHRGSLHDFLLAEIKLTSNRAR